MTMGNDLRKDLQEIIDIAQRRLKALDEAGRMLESFGQINQLHGGPLTRCHDCSAEHCPCIAK